MQVPAAGIEVARERALRRERVRADNKSRPF
jgi:hypothetical protein